MRRLPFTIFLIIALIALSVLYIEAHVNKNVYATRSPVATSTTGSDSGNIPTSSTDHILLPLDILVRQPVISVGATPLASGGKGSISLENNPAYAGATGNTAADVYVNGKKIAGGVGTSRISLDGYSPDGTYYAYRLAWNSGADTYEYSINVFDLVSGTYILVGLPPAENPCEPKGSQACSTAIPFIDFYSWDNPHVLNIVFYNISRIYDESSHSSDYYRITAQELWHYDLITGQYSFVKTLP